MAKLTSAFVRSAARPGKYTDGNGLMLRVMPSGSKQWIQRLVIGGRRRDLGLGGFPLMSLAEARDVAFRNRKVAREGGDPMAQKRAAVVPTFADALETVLAIQRGAWRDSGKSEKQWRASLDAYAMPRLGNMKVDAITGADVLSVLVPIWNEKRETARRVRQRIGAVMKWAVAEGHRTDNPAGDAIGAALPRNGGKVTHFRALHHADVAAAIAKVDASDAWIGTKLALHFVVLTAARSGEARGAEWSEIDMDAGVWTVPGARMKSGEPHRVPLSRAALDVLAEARALGDGTGLVFPSARGRVLSDSTMSKLLREQGVAGVTHGFRSSFRDWCGDTGKPRDIAEMALAHVVRGVEGAYARSDLFDRRRDLMEAWAAYLSADTSAKVVRLHG